MRAFYDSTTQKIGLIYNRKITGSDYTVGTTVTLSGDTLVFGPEKIFSANMQSFTLAWGQDINRFVVTDNNAGTGRKAVVGKIVGSTITLGSPGVFV